MNDAAQQPDEDDLDKSLYGDHASGRYGDQAYGRVALSGDSSAAAHDGTNAQIVGGVPLAGTRGADDELNSPGISTDKKSDDTKPVAGA